MSDADVLVVGAGVFGLSVARACLARGLGTIVADHAAPGAGASGGVVGALAPHAPEGWDALKALQLDALEAMPAEIAALEAETGLATGYARPGRVVPLSSAEARERAALRAAEADARWAGAGRMAVLDAPPPEAAALLPPGTAPHGVLWDDLTARIWPRGYVAALAASVGARGGEIRQGWRALALTACGVAFDRGEIRARRVIVAAGHESFGLTGQPGDGVKGQAALLAASLPKAVPVLTHPGLFVVRQGPDHVAVGSTSEPGASGTGTDRRLDGVIEKARALVPALRDAPVAERWAGIRPRAASRAPVLGGLPGHEGVLIAAGGFKIGLALAHLVGPALAAWPDTPPWITQFLPEAPPPCDKTRVARSESL